MAYTWLELSMDISDYRNIASVVKTVPPHFIVHEETRLNMGAV